MLAGALACNGEKARAEALIQELGDAPQPVIGRVLYHVLCSEMEAAADWYERAIEQRDPFALIFAALRCSVRSDTRRVGRSSPA